MKPTTTNSSNNRKSNNSGKFGFISVAAALAAAGLIGLLFAYVTGVSICPLLSIVGIPCPSCGMTRAVLAVLNGDFRTAVYYHPLFFVPAILPFLYIRRKGSYVFKSRIRNGVVLGLLALLIITWILRLILGMPDTNLQSM